MVRKKTISHRQYIQAVDDVVWKHITEVNIADFPHRSWLSVLGIPKPLHAEIVHGGVGGKRVAYFGNGKRFTQDITVWEPPKEYSFRFHAESGFRVGYILDISNGPFCMHSGQYIITPSQNGVCLELQSIYELHGLWGLLLQLPVYMVLAGFQKYLLQGIKNNAEKDSA